MIKLGYKPSNIFQESMEHLLLAEKQLHSNMIGLGQSEAVTEDEANKYFDFIWTEIELVCKKLSFECTKLCICFCNSPRPTSIETSALLQVIEGTVLILVNNMHKLNSSGGKTFYEEALASSISAIQSTRQLLRAINDNEEGEGINERYRQATGIAWEGCKRLEQCPRNNKEAVLVHLKNQNSLICDAYDEISEEMDGDGGGWSQQLGTSNEDEEEEAKWTEKDKEFMIPAVNLIKASKILYKRIIAAVEKNGCHDKSKEVEELDQILEDCKPVSQTIDSLILDLYPPLNIDHVKLRSEQLVTQILSAVKLASQSHVITEEEQSQMEFVSHAVNHNYDKMKDIFKLL